MSHAGGSRGGDAHRWLIILVAGTAVTLLALLPPWSPVSPWRAPARLGSCTIVSVYAPDGHDAYEQDLRRRIRRAYPATTVRTVATDDEAQTLRHLASSATPCTAAISQMSTLGQARDGVGMFARVPVNDLRILVPVLRDGTGIPDWLLINRKADPHLIAYLEE